MNMNYPIIIKGNVQTGYSLFFQDFPHLSVHDDHLNLAIAKAMGTLRETLKALIQEDELLPQASPVETGCAFIALPEWVVAKCCLYQAMKMNGIDRSHLAFRLDCDRAVVDRLLDLDRASNFKDIAAAFSASANRPFLIGRDSARSQMARDLRDPKTQPTQRLCGPLLEVMSIERGVAEAMSFNASIAAAMRESIAVAPAC